MSNLFGRCALAALVLGPLLASLATANQASSKVTCQIRASQSGSLLKLQAVATSPVAMRGEYELVVTKTGSGGSSDVIQGDEFETGPGAESLLGEVTFTMDGNSRVQAALKLDRSNGERLCEARYSGSI